MANKMLIDATHPEETRVVVLRGNRVEEFDFETAHRKQLRGNIYLAKVTRVEPSLQAAFVDYGGNRHGFLAFSEIHPDYYQIPVADRQALLDDDARAARESDSDDDHRGRRRHRERAAAHRDESAQSAPVAANEQAAEGTAEHGDSTGFEAEPGEAAAESYQPIAESEPQPGEHEPAAGAADTGPAPSHEEPAPVLEQADQRETEPLTAAAETSESAPSQEAPAGDESAAADDVTASAARADAADGNGHAGNGHGGNGADEEEEVVDTVGGSDALEEVAERTPRFRRQYKIQEVIKRRQVMLVQVVKEERGTKGAALTTYLSLAGRYCVLMPNTARGGGISRKITSPDDRKKLREIAEDLEVPEGMGVILRTAGASRTKAEVKRDFEYLLRLWEQVRDLTLKSTAPTLVYEEGSLAKRSIRDLYTKDIDEVVVAGEQGYRDAKEFMRMLMPSHARNVKLYQDSQPIFTRYGIESQLDAMFSPTVQLRSGGYIVINQTEALVSIDVNSGRSTREHHIEDTALKTNVEAAEEIARQLRLRDLAGLIVIDFIDMDEKRNNRTVERRLKDALRNDRARIQVGRISHFGLLEMSRQRIRTSVLESSTEKCVHCGGTGHVRSVSSVSLQLLRGLEELLLKGPTHNLVVRTRPEIALYVLNHKRAHLTALEDRFRITITINADAEVGGQTGFVIDRGEQVMSLEQAKALVAQAQTEAPPALVEEEEPAQEFPEDAAEEAEIDGEREPAQARESHADGEHDSSRDGESAREGGRGRRRRRRRGRGRGGEERQPAPMHGHAPQPGEHEAFEHEGMSPGSFAPSGEESLAGGEAVPHEGTAEARSDEGMHGGENGERRRRRRGRRGGRRNRRDRDSHNGEFASAHGHGGDFSSAPGHGDEAVPGVDRPQWADRSEAPRTDIAESTYAPRIEPAAPQPFAPPPEAPAPAAAAPEAPEPAPRRRSTVREPAPVFGTSPTPMPPPPQPAAPPPMVVTTNEPDDASRPRRTGWWARRFMGGDKG